MSAAVLEQVQGTFPVADLRHDVPVDRTHVDKLSASIRERGQLSPIVVWAQRNEIIDGFHRAEALKELGFENALVTIVDCTEDEFLDLRVIAAALHKSVSFARVTLWVLEAFERTMFAREWKAHRAFFRASNYRSLERRGKAEKLSPYERQMLEWVEAKANVWGLAPGTIAQMLYDADGASPAVTSLVRNQRGTRSGRALNRSELSKLARDIKDHAAQEAVAKKIIAENIPEGEARNLIESVAKAPAEKQEVLLSTSWLDWARVAKGENRKPTIASEIGVLTARLDWARASLRMLPPDLDEAQRARVDEALTGMMRDIERFYGQDTSALERLQFVNDSLDAENRRLKKQIEELKTQNARLQATLGLGQRLYLDNTEGGAA